ncbi:MAG TPA: hypothetical protein VKA36_11125 [Solirubrobacterales bacterium]|nr:hypothetical protein [Solirubrobacterales bacterium]
MESWHPEPWMIPLIVVALIVPAFLGFAIGGTALGTAIGALTFAALIVIAARSVPRGPIDIADAAAAPLLALALSPIESAETANRIAVMAEADAGDEPEDYAVLVLAPQRPTVAQRWLSDVEPGQISAQERLAVSIATLAAAGCHAEGRVVDESPLQAIEDIAAQHGASRIVIVTDPGSDAELLEEVRDRVDRPVERLETRPAS